MSAETDMHGVGLGEPALIPCRVGVDGFTVGVNEDRVVGGDLCRAGNRGRPFDPVRVAKRPFIGLLRSHRPPEDELQCFNAKLRRIELVLRPDVIADRDLGKRGLAERWRRIVRRGRHPVADLAWQDDEVLLGIQCHPLTDEDLHVLVRARVHVGEEDSIVLRRVQCAAADVRDLAVPELYSHLQFEITKREEFEGPVDVLRVIFVLYHYSRTFLSILAQALPPGSLDPDRLTLEHWNSVDGFHALLKFYVFVIHERPWVELWAGEDAMHTPALHAHVARVIDREARGFAKILLEQVLLVVAIHTNDLHTLVDGIKHQLTAEDLGHCADQLAMVIMLIEVVRRLPAEVPASFDASRYIPKNVTNILVIDNRLRAPGRIGLAPLQG